MSNYTYSILKQQLDIVDESFWHDEGFWSVKHHTITLTNAQWGKIGLGPYFNRSNREGNFLRCKRNYRSNYWCINIQNGKRYLLWFHFSLNKTLLELLLAITVGPEGKVWKGLVDRMPLQISSVMTSPGINFMPIQINNSQLNPMKQLSMTGT